MNFGVLFGDLSAPNAFQLDYFLLELCPIFKLESKHITSNFWLLASYLPPTTSFQEFVFVIVGVKVCPADCLGRVFSY